LFSPLAGILLLLWLANAIAVLAQDATPLRERKNPPPRVIEAQRFLAQRDWTGARASVGPTLWRLTNIISPLSTTSDGTGSTAAWQPLGPAAVDTANYGLVTGRVSSIAFDPADATGNRIYLGTTGVVVWLSQNAGTSNTANVLFAPMTDTLGAMSDALDSSISIGAITVQPGGTGVIEVMTGGTATSAHSAGLSRWGLAPAVAGLILLPLAWRRRKILMMAALLGVLAGGVSSCTGSGGGSGGTPTGGQGNSNTPPGTYSIPVSVSSNGVVHKVTLTLTVD